MSVCRGVLAQYPIREDVPLLLARCLQARNGGMMMGRNHDDPFGELFDEFDGGQEPSPGANQATLLIAPAAPGDDSCWGAQLRGSTVMCSAGFTLGKGHFKNKASQLLRIHEPWASAAIAATHRIRQALHRLLDRTGPLPFHAPAQFCLECRTHGIGVLESRVRVVLPTCPLKNTLKPGFWNPSPDMTAYFRVISMRSRLPHSVSSPLAHGHRCRCCCCCCLLARFRPLAPPHALRSTPQPRVRPQPPPVLPQTTDQTAECRGLPLLITSQPFLPSEHLLNMPDHLVEDGLVTLFVSKGTLVPHGAWPSPPAVSDAPALQLQNSVAVGAGGTTTTGPAAAATAAASSSSSVPVKRSHAAMSGDDYGERSAERLADDSTPAVPRMLEQFLRPAIDMARKATACILKQPLRIEQRAALQANIDQYTEQLSQLQSWIAESPRATSATSAATSSSDVFVRSGGPPAEAKIEIPFQHSGGAHAGGGAWPCQGGVPTAPLTFGSPPPTPLSAPMAGGAQPQQAIPLPQGMQLQGMQLHQQQQWLHQQQGKQQMLQQLLQQQHACDGAGGRPLSTAAAVPLQGDLQAGAAINQPPMRTHATYLAPPLNIPFSAPHVPPALTLTQLQPALQPSALSITPQTRYPFEQGDYSATPPSAPPSAPSSLEDVLLPIDRPFDRHLTLDQPIDPSLKVSSLPKRASRPLALALPQLALSSLPGERTLSRAFGAVMLGVIFAEASIACSTNSAAGKVLTLVLAVAWLAADSCGMLGRLFGDGASRQLHKVAVTIWLAFMLSFPMVFMLDDYLRTPADLAERLSWAPSPKGAVAALLYAAVGAMHSVSFFACEYREATLAISTVLTTLRCVILETVTGEWRLAAMFAAMTALPLAAGFMVGRRLLASPKASPPHVECP